MTTKLIPYLMLNGNAKEAIQFYKDALDGELVGIVTFGDMPSDPNFPIPEEVKERVAHATVKIGESELMFSDSFPGQDARSGDQVMICITTDNPTRSKKLFDSLQQGGQITMPLQETSFSPSYGVVKDKFGVTFQIYTEHQEDGNKGCSI